jgi:hypothetical protein
MNKELPKIDLPEEWVIGTGISKELLSLYTNFPCRLKAEIFVLCMEGEIEASVNLNRIYLSIAGVLNVLLNLFFVIQCNMAAGGVAIASVIAQYVSAILVVSHQNIWNKPA